MTTSLLDRALERAGHAVELTIVIEIVTRMQADQDLRRARQAVAGDRAQQHPQHMVVM